MRNHHIKGFSLVEILIVIAVIGIIAGTGMIYTTNNANMAKISNEYTHLIQLIKKYSMVSEKQSEPMLLEFDFSNNDTQTLATLKKYKDSSYKRLSSTDCEDLDTTYQEVVALNKDDHIFENVRILICPSHSSSSLTYDGICYTGRGETYETAIFYLHSGKDSKQDCNDIEGLISSNYLRKLTVYSTGYVEDERNF